MELMRIIPSHVIGKGSLQKANVGHCDDSFQDSFGDDVVKDRARMAFYAFSKINFCPVLRSLVSRVVATRRWPVTAAT